MNHEFPNNNNFIFNDISKPNEYQNQFINLISKTKINNLIESYILHKSQEAKEINSSIGIDINNIKK